MPANLSVTNITGTTAKLNWDAVAGAEGYLVSYKAVNTKGSKFGTTNNTSKSITGLLPNTAYKWEVRTFCKIDPPYEMSDWSSIQKFTTGSLRMADESPQRVSLQIYPNPAVANATIQFALPASSHVNIKMYDVSGKEMETLLDDEMQEGQHSLSINTTDFSRGVYVVKMMSDFGTENQKLIMQ